MLTGTMVLLTIVMPSPKYWLWQMYLLAHTLPVVRSTRRSDESPFIPVLSYRKPSEYSKSFCEGVCIMRVSVNYSVGVMMW